MILVSIVIPCFNVENYLVECLESVLHQSYQNTEIICIENNSSDKTPLILKEYAGKYPTRITLLTELKQGAPAARNKGLALAKGEWIQFLDADDKLLPEKIKNQVAEIENIQNSADVLISPLTRVFPSSEVIHIGISDEIWTGIVTSRAGSTCSNLYKKELLVKIKGWDETRESSQEAWLLFTLLKNGASVHFFNKDETVVNARSTGSISNTNRQENWQRYLFFRKEIWDYLKSKDQLSPQLETKLKGYIFDSVRMIYKTDKRRATELFNTLIKFNFTPVVSDATSALYIFLFKLMGFSLTEKLFSILK
jgi:glycosyltransferase involved in cell wall biosynthesis